MAWVESHQSLGRHPKTRKMARLLEINTVTVIGHLHLLWWWAIDYAEDGDLSEFDAADIAVGAEWAGDPDVFVEALRECGTGGGNGFLTESMQIHDWHDYAGKLVERRRANRRRMREARSASASDVQRTDSERDSKAAERKTPKSSKQVSSDGVQRTSSARAPQVSSHRTNQTNQPNPTNQGSAPTSSPRSPKTKQLDAMKDALADAVGYRPASGNKAAWGPFQSAASSLVAEGAKPEDVPRVAKAYRREWPDVEMTPTSLAKHWARFARRKSPIHEGRRTDPRTEADLLVLEASERARDRDDWESISRELSAALNDASDPVGAVKTVREQHGL